MRREERREREKGGGFSRVEKLENQIKFKQTYFLFYGFIFFCTVIVILGGGFRGREKSKKEMRKKKLLFQGNMLIFLYSSFSSSSFFLASANLFWTSFNFLSSGANSKPDFKDSSHSSKRPRRSSAMA